MGNEPTPMDKPPSSGGRLKYLLIALGPVPVGLLIGTSKAVLKSSGGPSVLFVMAIAALFCCVIGSIGMLGGYDEDPKRNARIGGITLGIVLFIVEVIISFFLGCVIIAS